jgi:hypothetical protein
LRSLKDAEKDLQELKLKRRNENNSEEWASVVKEAKDLRGVQSKRRATAVNNLRSHR